MYLLLSNGWKQAKIDESPIHIYNSEMKMNRTSNWNERSRSQSQSPNEMFAAYLFSKLHSTRLRNVFELVYAFHLLSINTYISVRDDDDENDDMIHWCAVYLWIYFVIFICWFDAWAPYVHTHIAQTPVKTNTQNT